MKIETESVESVRFEMHTADSRAVIFFSEVAKSSTISVVGLSDLESRR